MFCKIFTFVCHNSDDASWSRRAPTEIVCTLKDLSGVKITEEYLKHGIMGTGIPAGGC